MGKHVVSTGAPGSKNHFDKKIVNNLITLFSVNSRIYHEIPGERSVDTTIRIEIPRIWSKEPTSDSGDHYQR